MGNTLTVPADRETTGERTGGTGERTGGTADSEPYEEPCEVPDADPSLPDVPEPVDHDDCGRSAGKVRTAAKQVLPYLIALGALSVAITSAGGIRDGLKALSGINLWWVVAAVTCEGLCFLLLSLHLRCLAGPQSNARRLAPLRIALVVFGLGSVLPAAPAEGLVMAGAALRRRRLAHRRTILVLGVSQWFSTASLYAIAALDALVVVLVARLDFPNRWMLVPAAVLTISGLVTLGYLGTRRRFAELAALVVGRLRHPRHPHPATEWRDRGAAWHDAAMHVVSGPAAWAALLLTAGGAWVADAACLHFALVAVGARVGLEILLLAYAVGAIASYVPLLPAGLGVVETVTPAILHLGGVPLATALAGILVYRVLGTILPAFAGAVAALLLRVEDSPDPSSAETDGLITSVPLVATPGPAPSAALT